MAKEIYRNNKEHFYSVWAEFSLRKSDSDNFHLRDGWGLAGEKDRKVTSYPLINQLDSRITIMSTASFTELRQDLKLEWKKLTFLHSVNDDCSDHKDESQDIHCNDDGDSLVHGRVWRAKNSDIKQSE